MQGNGFWRTLLRQSVEGELRQRVAQIIVANGPVLWNPHMDDVKFMLRSRSRGVVDNQQVYGGVFGGEEPVSLNQESSTLQGSSRT